MRLDGTIVHQLRAALAALLLLPFVLAQTFAPGTMPGKGQDGFEIVICTEAGFQTVVLGPEGAPVPAPEGHDDICPWATMGAAFVAMAQPAAQAPDLTLQPAALALPQPQIAHAAFAPLPPARAPPRLI